ncbi:MAG: zinc ribbon domain-containing protein [Deltaproteobacteria bacterium]|nr:zinc ribbon domain-containing protein [Deltaproteobacteria bacterium]MBN2674306.1 zinc ribbon domain-containing protein [Deltaproteobacteria bacterium]
MKCEKCGQLTDEGSVFCGNCGAKMSPPKTDASESETPQQGAATLTSSGADASPQEKAPVTEAPPVKPYMPAKDEQRTSPVLIAVAVVGALLFLAAAVAGVYFFFMYDESTAQTNTVASKDASSTPKTATALPAAAVEPAAELSPFDDSGVKVKITTVNNPALVKNIDASVNMVEVTRSDNKKNFGFYSTVKIPYEASAIDSGENVSDCVVAAYYQPKTKNWAPVLFELDTRNRQVIISTDHFSLFAVFTFKNKGKRTASAQIPSSINMSNLPKVEYSKILSEVSEGTDRAALEAGFGIVNDSFNFAGNSLTLATEPFRIIDPLSKWPRVDKIGNAALGIGVALAGVQLVLDYQQEGKVGAKTLCNAIKNASFLAISKFGSSALKIKSVGFFLIDYSLTSFGNEAWNNLADKHRKMYINYYNRRYGGETGEQKQLLRKVYETYRKSLSQKDKFDLAKEVRLALTTHCEEFWKQGAIETVDNMSQMSDTWFSNLTDSKQKEISEGYCAQLMSTVGKAIMENMIQRIQMDLYKEYMLQLNRMKSELNQQAIVTIYEPREDEDTPYQYVGHLVRFAPLGEDAEVKSWQGRLPDDATVTVPFRLAGYLTAGSPTKIQVFAPGDNPDEDEPVLEVPFELNRKKIQIALKPSKQEFAGTYRATVPSRRIIMEELQKLGYIGTATDAPVEIVVDEKNQMHVKYHYSYTYRTSEEDEEPSRGGSDADFTLPVNEDGSFRIAKDGEYFKGKIHESNGKMVVDVEMTESSFDESIRKVVRFTATRQD